MTKHVYSLNHGRSQTEPQYYRVAKRKRNYRSANSKQTPPPASCATRAQFHQLDATRRRLLLATTTSVLLDTVLIVSRAAVPCPTTTTETATAVPTTARAHAAAPYQIPKCFLLHNHNSTTITTGRPRRAAPQSHHAAPPAPQVDDPDPAADHPAQLRLAGRPAAPHPQRPPGHGAQRAAAAGAAAGPRRL